MGGGINGNRCPSAESQQAETGFIHFLLVVKEIKSSL
jgi:hypothetical protein